MTKSSSAKKALVDCAGESGKNLELVSVPKPNDNNKKRPKPGFVKKPFPFGKH